MAQCKVRPPNKLLRWGSEAVPQPKPSTEKVGRRKLWMRADIKRRTDVKTNLMEREEPCYCRVESQTRLIPALAGTTQSKSKQDVIIINLLSAKWLRSCQIVRWQLHECT